MTYPTIRVFKRADILSGNVNIFQASIVSDNFGYHGVGQTPAEALVLAAQHWQANEV